MRFFHKKFFCAWVLILVCAFQTAYATTRYVAIGGGHQAPYTNWSMAATNIASAYTAAANGDTIVISNGTHQITGQIYWNKSNITVTSLYGRAETLIDGSARLVLYASCDFHGITFANFTTPPIQLFGDAALVVRVYRCEFRNNIATQAGAAVYVYAANGRFEAYNCVFKDNESMNTNIDGGAIRIISGYVRLENCLLTGNRVARRGGAAWLSSDSEVVNCTIMHNEAVGMSRGGLSGGQVVNSIIYSNTSPSEPNYGGLSSITHSITDPLPGGEGNIVDNPMLDSDFKPVKGSPAINAGVNQGWMTGARDLAGHSRIGEGIVDIGVYEYHPPGTVLMFW